VKQGHRQGEKAAEHRATLGEERRPHCPGCCWKHGRSLPGVPPIGNSRCRPGGGVTPVSTQFLLSNCRERVTAQRREARETRLETAIIGRSSGSTRTRPRAVPGRSADPRLRSRRARLDPVHLSRSTRSLIHSSTFRPRSALRAASHNMMPVG
jgi:hypothetical protein